MPSPVMEVSIKDRQLYYLCEGICISVDGTGDSGVAGIGEVTCCQREAAATVLAEHGRHVCVAGQRYARA